jgi:hypothetical protein
MTLQGETRRGQVPSGDAEVWAAIRSDWPRRDFRKLHELAESLGDVPVADIDRLFDEEAPADETARNELGKAFAAAGSAENRVLVALYVYARCLDTWERSTDYPRIRTVLRALPPAAEHGDGDGSARENELLRIVVAQTVALDDSMAVESGFNCSCPVETGSKAGRVAARMGHLLEQLRELGTDSDERAKLMREDAEAQGGYFDEVSKTAAAVLCLVDPDAAPDIVVPEEGDADLRSDVYASELRAHRATLAALRKAESQPRLHVDRAELVYVYPFALDLFDTGEIARRMGETISLAALGSNDLEVHELQLTDLWRRLDRADFESGYGGASIALPPIRVKTTGDDVELEFDAEVRLSRLGNHYLRVSSTLEHATLHGVNQALRRGSRSMGEERIASAAPEPWARLTEYARDAIEAVADAIKAEASGEPDASFHIAVAASEITVREPGKEPRPAKLDDLRNAVGASLLFQPVPGLATALEEWVRYPRPEVRNLLGRGGYEGELVARTANTTVLYMPDSPDWRTAGYQEMIEFVASLPPLLQLWERQAASHADTLEFVLKRLTTRLDKVESSELDDDVEDLHRREAKQREFEGRIRKELGFLHSPALCRDRSQREFIDALWDAAGLNVLEADLERRLESLSALQERVSTIAAAIAAGQRREEQDRAQAHASRIETALQVFGTALAVVSVAGLFSWLNDGFKVKHRAVTVAELVFLFVAIVVILLVFRRLSKARAG